MRWNGRTALTSTEYGSTTTRRPATSPRRSAPTPSRPVPTCSSGPAPSAPTRMPGSSCSPTRSPTRSSSPEAVCCPVQKWPSGKPQPSPQPSPAAACRTAPAGAGSGHSARVTPSSYSAIPRGSIACWATCARWTSRRSPPVAPTERTSWSAYSSTFACGRQTRRRSTPSGSGRSSTTSGRSPSGAAGWLSPTAS